MMGAAAGTLGVILVGLLIGGLIAGERAKSGGPAPFIARLGWSVRSSRYPDLARDGGVGYLILMSLIAFAAALYMVAWSVPGITRDLGRFWAEVPDFSITNGTISVSGPNPHNYGTAADPLIVDTTGEANPAVLDAAPAGALVTSRMIYLKRSALQTDSYDIGRMGLTIDKSGLQRLVARWLWPRWPST